MLALWHSRFLIIATRYSSATYDDRRECQLPFSVGTLAFLALSLICI
jgi:hypothetical protein